MSSFSSFSIYSEIYLGIVLKYLMRMALRMECPKLTYTFLTKDPF